MTNNDIIQKTIEDGLAQVKQHLTSDGFYVAEVNNALLVSNTMYTATDYFCHVHVSEAGEVWATARDDLIWTSLYKLDGDLTKFYELLYFASHCMPAGQ